MDSVNVWVAIAQTQNGRDTAMQNYEFQEANHEAPAKHVEDGIDKATVGVELLVAFGITLADNVF